jgi:hypothetical protein
MSATENRLVDDHAIDQQCQVLAVLNQRQQFSLIMVLIALGVLALIRDRSGPTGTRCVSGSI